MKKSDSKQLSLATASILGQPPSQFKSIPQKGYTLVELLIAMLLGLVLMAGMFQIFISNKQSYRVSESQSRLQENARFAMQLLTKDVREAGYSGCRALSRITATRVADPPLPSFDLDSSIIGRWWVPATSSWSLTPPITPLITVTAGTDVLTIQKGQSCGARITGNTAPNNANVQVTAPNACNFSADDVTMITDCESAHILRVNSVSGGSPTSTVNHSSAKNTANHFCKSYPNPYPASNTGTCTALGVQAKTYTTPPAQLLVFTSHTYFIQPGVNGMPALWRLDNTQGLAGGNNPVELIENVENLQVLFGLSPTGNGIAAQYAAANTFPTPPTAPGGGTPNDWSNVISARIDLLVETQNNRLTTGDTAYTYNGANVTSTDGRVHRVFSSTITIRNRLL